MKTAMKRGFNIKIALFVFSPSPHAVVAEKVMVSLESIST
jgi:adenylyl- and sulfurtransferase ThiI